MVLGVKGALPVSPRKCSSAPGKWSVTSWSGDGCTRCSLIQGRQGAPTLSVMRIVECPQQQKVLTNVVDW